jgi:hypothetical protein
VLGGQNNEPMNKIKRLLIIMFFTKEERVHIWQSFFVRINKLTELRTLQKYWDAYNYDEDIKQLERCQNLFRVDGNQWNDFEP